jgi:hypothetical protein
MVLIQGMDSPDYWWGEISIEGYHYLVRIKKFGRQMKAEFLDVKQPFWAPETLEAMV